MVKLNVTVHEPQIKMENVFIGIIKFILLFPSYLVKMLEIKPNLHFLYSFDEMSVI